MNSRYAPLDSSKMMRNFPEVLKFSQCISQTQPSSSVSKRFGLVWFGSSLHSLGSGFWDGNLAGNSEAGLARPLNGDN